jgi:hypothetical protein
MDMSRDFSYVWKRWELYNGGRLAFLQQELYNYEKERTDHLRCLTKNQKRPPGHPPIMEDHYDILMNDLASVLQTHASIRAQSREMRQLYPVPREQYRDLLEHMAEHGMLEREGYLYFDSPDEFSSVFPLPPLWVIRFLYSPFGKWVIVSDATAVSPSRSGN